jgi:N-methylhydantoinase A
MQLDVERAWTSLQGLCGASSGFRTAEEAAEGVVRVANVRMESALRRVSVERGYAPRDFALLAFGGAGPLHACALAESLGIGKVVIPAAPGALSALGILDADLEREFSRTVMADPGSAKIARAFRDLEAEARRAFAAERSRLRLTRWADLRYQGQGFELRVAWGGDAVAEFNDLHARRYGYADPTRRVEVVTLRVQAVVPAPRPRAQGQEIVRGDGRAAHLGQHRVFEGRKWHRAALYERTRLKAGDRVRGPALIVELSATTYLAQGWSAAVDGYQNLVLARVRARAGGVR